MNQSAAPFSVLEHAGPTIGQLLLDKGKLSPLQAEKILHLQRESGLRFGELAMRLGYISQVDIDQVLAAQFSYPYLPAGDSRFDSRLIAAYQPFLPEVEQLRSLRSQLMLRWITSGQRIIAVASPSESGASHQLAANLAIVFSQLGEHTLLIDADMRQQPMGGLFGLSPSAPGLAEVLSNRADDADAIVQLDVLRDLSILPAGAHVPNPQELLSRSRFALLLKSASSEYEVIIVNTPPYRLAADVQIVAAAAGGAIISVEMRVTSVEEVSRLRHALETAGSEVLGTVLQRAIVKKR